MLQSLKTEKSRMTVYPSGVCYLNATLFDSIRKRSMVPVKVTVKTDGEGCLVVLPISTASEEEPDSRKVSVRGGGGSFSFKALSEAVGPAARSFEMMGPMQIDADNPTGYRSAEPILQPTTT